GGGAKWLGNRERVKKEERVRAEGGFRFQAPFCSLFGRPKTLNVRAPCHVDPATSRRQTVAAPPGFTRRPALWRPYAFVGLSKIHEQSAMTGVPLAERREHLKCGVAVVDLRSGRVSAFLEFQTAVEEIFDVQLLPGLRFPEVIGFQQETIQHTFIVPRESQ